uniref:Uncharacterized protein n=1 Tax=Arundo donax TaxID=35708 RepID=A0A0A9AAZ4_ARUDO
MNTTENQSRKPISTQPKSSIFSNHRTIGSWMT